MRIMRLAAIILGAALFIFGLILFVAAITATIWIPIVDELLALTIMVMGISLIFPGFKIPGIGIRLPGRRRKR